MIEKLLKVNSIFLIVKKQIMNQMSQTCGYFDIFFDHILSFTYLLLEHVLRISDERELAGDHLKEYNSK
jgi:hypothetical protein